MKALLSPRPTSSSSYGSQRSLPQSPVWRPPLIVLQETTVAQGEGASRRPVRISGKASKEIGHDRHGAGPPGWTGDGRVTAVARRTSVVLQLGHRRDHDG